MKKGTLGSGTKCCPTTTVCGRPELPSPLATTAVTLLVGWLQVMAVVLLLHPEPNALTVGVRRPFACELFCGSASSFRGVEGGGGAPCFGSGGGISSQSNSGARSDCFTMAAVALVSASEDQGLKMYDKSVPTSVIQQSKHAAGTGSLFPAAYWLFSMYL